MKLFIKHKHDVNWTDFTKYMNMPSFIMNLTTDGTFSSASFVLRTPKELGGMDLTKPIPPKMMVKITEANELENETYFNTWYFYTTDSNNARVRKEVEDQVSSLYVQEVNCEDPLSRLDNRYLPNYTITQPKTKFFSTFVKGGGAEFRLDQRFSQNGNDIKLAQGIRRELAKTNINGELTFNYDSVRQEHYLEFTELNEASLLINFQMEFSKSAHTTGKFSHPRIPFLKVSQPIMPYRLTGGFINRFESYSTSDIDFNFRFEYYDANDNLVRTKDNPFTVKYSSGEVPIENDRNMTALGSMQTNEQVFSLPREEEITKVRAYLKITNAREELMGRLDGTGGTTPLKVETRIPGFNDDDYVKAYIDRIVIKANTGSYDKEVESYPTMLIDFIEKAIFDYNLNTRDKVELSEDVKPLLSVVAKESEWGDFTLRELLERAFKYVGIIPILRPDNTISYSKTTKVSRYIDLEQKSDKQSEHINDNYYDKVVSTAKNLVSQEDFVREIIPLSSIETEFSNITTENAGFITSNDIYYLTNAILHTPGLEFDFGGGVKVNTNIGKPFYWDITERTFEEDIYNSFPNIRLDGFVGETEVSPRDYEGLLSKSNTIFYKSGSNYIGGLFNQGDYVPDYTPFGYIASLFSPSLDAEYAVIEMLIVLAYSQLAEPIGVNLPNPDIFLIDIASYELDITYVPIYKELTTKYLSNMSNRQGLDWEKKLNLRDRVISYENNEEVLRNEMEKKGNVKELFTEKYQKASDSIPINSIVNDNLYITSKQISFNKNAVEVEYVLQENFILQNEDIRLPVEFERYSIPYEYVEREIMLENHLIFQKRLEVKYTNMRPSSGAEFINRTLLDINNSLDGTLYAKVNIDENLYLMRVSKLETRFTMILAGKFLDNYIAGIQRYSNEEEQRIYTIPLSYTDGNGKFNVLKNLEIGYNESVEDLRLGLEGGGTYNIKMFPAGEYEENEAELNIRLIEEYRDLLYLKDAREKVSITHTSYLQNETDDLKFYRFKPITKLGVLLNDINLTDDLKLDQVDYLDYDENYTIELTEISANSFKITITSEQVDDFTNGIVFINEQDSKFTLVGIIKEPVILGDQVEFYISTTSTGTLTPKMLYLSFTIELEKELNYIQSETISIEREIDFTLNNYVGYQFNEKDLELGIILLGEASYIEADSFNILSYLEPTLNYDEDKVV